MLLMNAQFSDPVKKLSKARHRVEAYCQSLVDIGEAQWQINADGRTELHMESGEAYLLGELGVTRLR
jgi:hypothetical protein